MNEKSLRPRRQTLKADNYTDGLEGAFHLSNPYVADDQIEEIEKQLERQFRRLEELKSHKKKST